VDDFLEHLVRSVEGGTKGRVSGGITHDDVDASPLGHRGLHQRLEFRFVTHMAGMRESRAAGRGNLGSHSLAAVGVAAGDHHLGAVRRQLLRDRLADAAAGAGDERHLAGQIEECHESRPRSVVSGHCAANFARGANAALPSRRFQ
jgi:hypothetical protein